MNNINVNSCVLGVVAALLSSNILCADARVLINEIQSSNDETCTDERGNSPDWIELYNDSEEAVDISGWGLSDSANKPFKWSFPEGTSLEAERHLRIFADGGLVSNRVGDADVLPPNDDGLKDDLVAWFTGDRALEEFGDGGIVSEWEDLSGYGNNATNTTVSQCPLVVQDAINGHAALRFSAAKRRRLYLPKDTFNGMSSLSNVTVIVVSQWDGYSDNGNLGLFGLCQVDNSSDAYFKLSNEGAMSLRNGSGTYARTVYAGVTPERWYSFAFTTDSDRESPMTKMFLNGDTVCQNAAPVGPQNFAASDGYLMIGNAHRTSNWTYSGDIAEFIVFRRALNESEFAGIYSYLKNKYSLNSTLNHHASFSLSASGESLVLTDRDTNTVDSVEFETIPCDTSYGRLPSDSSQWRYYSEPTPGSANSDEGYVGLLAPVGFSKERAVCESGFLLELSHEDPGAVIYYTIDRTEPSAENGIVYEGPISIDKTTTVRATAVRERMLPYRNITSHTYLFVEDVFGQQKPEIAPETWQDAGSCAASYTLSQSVVFDEESRAEVLAALRALPIVAFNASDEDVFDPNTGIYCKPSKLNGKEIAASVEWLSGSDVFGVEAGVRIQGAGSRQFSQTPKKSFRVTFRGRYGMGTLEKPVFSPACSDESEFKSLVFRAEHNHSWPNVDGRANGDYMCDQIARDLQKAISGYGSGGSSVHLFVNGLYWGLYNVSERLDDAFAAKAFGGNKSNWDVIKRNLEVVDGDNVFVRRLWDACKMDLSQRENYDRFAQLLDIQDFVDYMLIETYVGNGDWPNNNWVAFGNSVEGHKFRYAVWDSEGIMSNTSANRFAVKSANVFSPMVVHDALLGSAEYRLLFADSVQRNLIEGGNLSTDAMLLRVQQKALLVKPSLKAESARWGAYRHDFGTDSAVYGLDHWEARYTSITNFVAQRPSKYLAQVRSLGLYPNIDAPSITIKDDKVTSATIVVPSGSTVYYTTDGTDPRVAFEGTVNPTANEYVADAEITVEITSVIKARALSAAGEWSALSEIELEGSKPELVKNVFLPSTNGENWDKAANWSEGTYPNEPGAYAVIGVPTAFKKDKGWRNIHINKSDVTVGHIEITGGSCTNRIDTGKSGNLTFCGKVDADGVALEDATFVVMDENDASLAMIDLDEPNKVILGSDTEFVVSNVVGDVKWGGVLAKGIWDGAGHNLAKSGAGRMTLDVTNAPETAFGKIQVAEGAIDITGKIYAEAITKDGICSAALGSTDLATAVDKASELSDKVSVNNVRLFIPSYVGGETYYGAFVANSLTTANAKKGKTATAYIRDNEGDTWFNDMRYRLLSGAEVKTIALEDGRVTYSVNAPMQDVTVIVDANGTEKIPDVALSTEETIRSVKDSGKIIIKGSSEISVDNTNHTITVDGTTYSIADYYDAKIIGKWVQLSFNENALPHYAESKEGADDALQIAEDGVTLGVHTKVGLQYTLQSRASLSDGEWTDVMTISGNDAVQKLEAEKVGIAGFYRIVVGD